MEPLYKMSEAPTFKPQVHKLKREIYDLFPMPKDGAVGTNSLNNAITIITFKNNGMQFEEHFKDALRQVGGVGYFLPPLSQETIGYAKTRYFVIFDFRTKQHEEHTVSLSIDDYIEKVAIADAKKLQFLFQIKRFDKDSASHRDFTNFIWLMDFGGKEPKKIKEIKKERGVGWFVDQNRIFMFNKDRMQVFTTSFEPAYHPIQDVIMRNKGIMQLWRVHIHPTLPFAVVADRRSKAFIVSWGQGRNEQPVTISNNDIEEFRFSPDGKWVVFRRYIPGTTSNYDTYLIPVSERYPNFLGSPIFLSEKSFSPNEGSWTTNPISFVGTNYDTIYRWELTTAAHPESTKSDFHEYIVEKDLEKLTKEKKQGLGGNTK